MPLRSPGSAGVKKHTNQTDSKEKGKLNAPVLLLSWSEPTYSTFY